MPGRTAGGAPHYARAFSILNCQSTPRCWALFLAVRREESRVSTNIRHGERLDTRKSNSRKRIRQNGCAHFPDYLNRGGSTPAWHFSAALLPGSVPLPRPSSASPERVGERFYGASIPCGSTCRQKRWPTASGDPQKTLVTEHRCRAAVREYLPRKAIFKASLRRRKRSERRRKSSLRCFYAEF
jgi:hypothetical protein